MNLHVRPAPQPAFTRAAEGRDRRAFTVAEVEAMVAAGVIQENERIELIGGELVPMSPKGAWHENVKRALTRHWIKALPADIEALTETTLRTGPIDYREPDFVFWPGTVSVVDLAPGHVKLLVEIANSSLDYDLGDKMRFFANIGIPEYWVIDARKLVTHIHREPGQGGFGAVTKHRPTSPMAPVLIPALAVRLADIGLKPG